MTKKPNKPTKAPVAVRDAWRRAFDLAQGIEELLSMAISSDKGLNPKACVAMRTAADQVIREMEVVNPYFTEMEKNPADTATAGAGDA